MTTTQTLFSISSLLDICSEYACDDLHDDTGVAGDTLRQSVCISQTDGKTYRPQLGGFFSDGAGDGGTLHFSLGVDYLRHC